MLYKTICLHYFFSVTYSTVTLLKCIECKVSHDCWSTVSDILYIIQERRVLISIKHNSSEKNFTERDYDFLTWHQNWSPYILVSYVKELTKNKSMQTAQSSAKAAVTLTLTLTEPDHRENLIIFCLSHCTPRKLSSNSPTTLWVILLTDRQKDRQTDEQTPGKTHRHWRK